MKALRKLRPEKGLWMEEVPTPRCSKHEVLIKTRMTGVCGTDLHIFNWDAWAQKTVPTPLTIGHEFVGDIVEFGSEVYGFEVGQRVSGEGHIVCGKCRNCRAGIKHLCIATEVIGVHRPGCFAEYLVLPGENVFPIPKGDGKKHIDDEEAAVLDPFGNAVHTALSFNLIGEDVLISGAGPIGIMAGIVAQHIGARNVVITDISDHRLQLAAKSGLKHVVNAKSNQLQEKIRELGMTEGFDVGLEMSGSSDALNQLIETLKAGGKIALLGIPHAECKIDLNKVIFKGLFLKGVFGREMFETWYKMCALLQSGVNIKPVFDKVVPANDFAQVFKKMSEGNCGKLILDWTKV